MGISIRAEDLSVRIGGQEILRGISAEIPAGKIVGFLGPSGAGKTTLIRTIVGRQRISGGKVTVLGEPAGAKMLRGRIGYMPQGAAIYPDLSVRENVRYFAAMLGVPKKDADATIEKVDLSKQANQLARTLSGGQKSRVSLAIALLGAPELLVLDEPTVGVDPVLRQQLWKLFRNIAADGTPIIISSHVMDEAEKCDELLLIRDGRILAQGSPESLREETGTKTIEESFLMLVGEKS